MGRLGNQMFEYAALRGIASARGYDWVVPPPGYPTSDNYGLFDCFEMTNCTGDNYGFGPATRVAEPHFHYSQQFVDTLPDNVDISGYFQSEKYFKHIEDSIREDFTIKAEFLDKMKSFVPDNAIFLHVRRGDPNLVGRRGERWSYQVQPQYHPVCEPDYYIKALEHFDKDRPVVVLSDVIEWCTEQEWLQGDRFVYSMTSLETFSDGAAVPYYDLAIMSLCDDAIIANSSMSWWGAWLIKNPSKTVIAPRRWFGEAYSHYNLDDLRPESWIQV